MNLSKKTRKTPKKKILDARQNSDLALSKCNENLFKDNVKQDFGHDEASLFRLHVQLQTSIGRHRLNH